MIKLGIAIHGKNLIVPIHEVRKQSYTLKQDSSVLVRSHHNSVAVADARSLEGYFILDQFEVREPRPIVGGQTRVGLIWHLRKYGSFRIYFLLDLTG